MRNLSPNAQLVTDIFEELTKGNGKPFWEACRDDVVWRTIGSSSWSGEFVGKQIIIDEVFRPLNRALVERATVPTRIIDGVDVIVLQARGKNLTRDGQRIGQPERVVQFAISQQSGVGRDAAAVEFQLQAAVKIDPQRPIIRFTRWVFHTRASNPTITC